MQTHRTAYRSLRLAVILALLSGFTPRLTEAQSATQDPTALLPFDKNILTGKLENGLTYFVRQNKHPEHRVELRLIIKAGSILENDDQQGLAHFCEHMAFNGTKKYPGNTLESFLEAHGARFGADLNASTSFDETIYKMTLPTDQGAVLDSGIDIMAEWAHNLTFDPNEFNRERGVVGEEWRLRKGAQDRIAHGQYPFLFHDSKYAKRLPIGLKPVLDTAHIEAITSFYHDWYRPNLMAVVIVGDIDPQAMVERVKQTFSPLVNPENERPRLEYAVPPHTENLVTVNTDKELTQVSFELYFKRPAPKIKTIGDETHSLAIDLYDQMLEARLQEMIQRNQAPFISGGAGDGRFIGPCQAYAVSATLRQDSVEAGIKGLLREVFRAKQKGFTQSELDRAKKRMMSAYERQYREREKTESTSYLREISNYFLRAEPASGIDYEYALAQQAIPAITLEEVNAVGKELTEHTSRVITFAGPDSKDFTPPSRGKLYGYMTSVEAENLAAYTDKAANEPLMRMKPKAGKITSERKLADIGVTVWTLSNGATVVVKPTDFKDNEILFAAQAAGGTSLAEDKDYLSATRATSFIEGSGLGAFDAVTLEKMLAGKECSVSPFMSELQQGFGGRSTTKDLETMLQLTYLYCTAPRLDTVATASAMARMRSMLQNRAKQPEAAYQDTLQVTLSNGHYRARPMTKAMVDEIDPKRSYEIYRKRFSDLGGATFFFVGNVELSKLRTLVTQYLAPLPGRPKHETWRDIGLTMPKGVITKKVVRGTEPKSLVTLVYGGDATYSREERFRLAAMAQAFEIKLREDIREDKSGVYSVSVRPTVEQYPRPRYRLSIQFGCDPKRVDELVTEVMKQIDTLRSTPIAQTYVDRVHKILLNENETNLKRNAFWLAKLQDAYWNGLAPATIPQSPSLINAFTSKDVQEMAKRYFNPSNVVEVYMTPEPKTTK